MNDVPNPAPADDAELLAAYLDADLDAEAAAALEARLAAEPGLAADLEAERELRELLGGASVPEPPEGFEARLRARLDEERGPEAAAAPVTSMAARRQRRRAVNWGAMGGIAAALVAVAVVGASVLTQGAGDTDMAVGDSGVETDAGAADDSAREFLDAEGGDTAADTDMDTMEAPAATAEEEEASDDASTFATEADGAEATEPAEDEGAANRTDMAMGAQEPFILSTGTALADEEAVRAYASDLPEAHSLLGMAGQEATDTAAAYRVAVQRAEPFPSGVHPAACLDTVAGGTEGTVAPVRVEEITYGGEPSLLYVLVVATGDAFDRVEGWIVAPDSCATGLFVNLS